MYVYTRAFGVLHRSRGCGHNVKVSQVSSSQYLKRYRGLTSSLPLSAILYVSTTTPILPYLLPGIITTSHNYQVLTVPSKKGLLSSWLKPILRPPTEISEQNKTRTGDGVVQPITTNQQRTAAAALNNTESPVRVPRARAGRCTTRAAQRDANNFKARRQRSRPKKRRAPA